MDHSTIIQASTVPNEYRQILERLEALENRSPLDGLGELPVAKLAQTLSPYLLRIGLASIFLVNGLFAIIQPETFHELLRSTPVGSGLSSELTAVFVGLAAINDLLLGVVLLSGRWQKFAYLWMAGWLLVVALTKLMTI